MSLMEKKIAEWKVPRVHATAPDNEKELRELISLKKAAVTWHRESMNFEEKEVKRLELALIELQKQHVPIRRLTIAEGKKEQEKVAYQKKLEKMTPEQLDAEIARLSKLVQKGA